MPEAAVSVVVPYFNDQSRLTLLLQALAQQQCQDSFEVVIADDGSSRPPDVPSGLGFGCTVVRQPDRGFRAAAARNLGASAAVGGLLVFLDGDTLPGSGYLQAMVHRLRALGQQQGALVQGRRRHADLAAAETVDVLAFLRGEPTSDQRARHMAPGIGLLDDPAWLLDGYARTDNLRAATEEDFRLVISAVLGVDRQLWQATGGFDETFVGYGGEDWDFAWRAWQAGANWAYEPGAVAWHDGPDAAGRGSELAVKNAESLRLAGTIPLPSVRGTGLLLPQPDVVVRYLGPITGTVEDAAVVACIGGLLANTDAAVWFPGASGNRDDASTGLPPLLVGDPRVHAGEVPPGIAGRARYQVWVDRPVQMSASLSHCCALGEWDLPGLLRIRRTRAVNRGEPAPVGAPAVPSIDGRTHPEGPTVQQIPPDVSLERWWAGW